jgi:hypothetical protein
MPSDQIPGSTVEATPQTSMRGDCETFSLQLAAVADGANELNPEAADHFKTCLRCQAELVQYKKLLRALASLRSHRLSADESLVQEILHALERGDTVHRLQRLTSGSKTRKVAYIGGIAAAATAGAAGAFVLASKLASRQRLAS